MKQTALAVNTFENTFQELPKATYGTGHSPDPTAGSPFTKLLPFIEQENLARQYDWAQHWGADANQPVVNTVVKTYRCPAAPGPLVQKGVCVPAFAGVGPYPTNTAAAGDYSVPMSSGFNPATPQDPYVTAALSPLSSTMMGPKVTPRFAAVTDGSSNSLVLVESGARSQLWVKGKLAADPSTAGFIGWYAPWAGFGAMFVGTYTADGQTQVFPGFGPCTVNCNNGSGVYAFHPGGANVAFLDGSVRFLKESIDGPTLAALISRSLGEVVNDAP
jgi:prepilin-type processing-associated H-X9-DG protein